MHIKRFRAASVAEALRAIKAELGPDALVLSTKTIRPRLARFGAFAKTSVEVTAAVDRELRRGAAPAPAPTLSGASAPDEGWRALALSKALLEPIEGELRALRQQLKRVLPESGEAGLREELGELRTALHRVSEEKRWERVDPASPKDALRAIERSLEARAFPRDIAATLAREAEERARSAGDSENSASHLEAVIAAHLDARFTPPRNDDDTSVHLLVGAPGVGKSTSIAKLASRQEFCERGALLSVDGDRTGAFEALQAYAARANMPFATASSPEAIQRSIARMGRGRVLIDTRGCGRCDREGQGELLRLRSALGDRTRVHWVVAATSDAEQIRRESERFRPLRPDSLILTRVDETVSLAHVFSTLTDPKMPAVSWFGVGQHVPDDLEIPDPKRVAQAMLGAPL